MNIAIIILAAGNSSRMGTPKQLLPINNTTLLGKAILNAINANTKNVFCVLGAYAEDIQLSVAQLNVDIIINENYDKGLSSSIAKAIEIIESMNFEGVLIMLGDQPKIDSNYLNKLIQTFEEHPTKIIATNYHHSKGVPAIFPKSVFKSLLQLKGDKGAKTFLNSSNTEAISIESELLTDIDTQNDYLNYLKSIK